MTLQRTALTRKPVTERKPKGLRARKCSNCGTGFTQQRMGQQVCSPPCAQSFGRRISEQQQRKADKVRKQALKTRSDHMKDAQAAFNAAMRARDADKLCISCDTPLYKVRETGGDFDCGHYRSVGSAPHLRFDERNAHGQCKKCNRYLAGNAVNYRANLIARIGLAAVEALEADQTPRKWTVDDLQAIKSMYRAMLKKTREKA
jgi:hypothetical protein